MGLSFFFLAISTTYAFNQSVDKSAGMKLFDNGDFAGAIEALKKSNDLVELNYLGNAYEKVGNMKEAGNAFDRSFKIGFTELADGLIKRTVFAPKNSPPEDKLSVFLENHLGRFITTASSARRTLELKGPSSKSLSSRKKLEMFAEVGRILSSKELVYSGRELDKDVKILSKPRTSYTDEARKNGTQGTVELLLLMDADAKIKGSIAIRELPDGLTEQAYLAASRIVFTPAQKAGKPVPVLKVISYSYSIY